MFKFQKQRVQARKILLNRTDVITFDSVPDHIVDAFFGYCSYKNRLLVTAFAFLNGIHIEQLMQLIRWKDTSEVDRRKMATLYKDFEKPHYMCNYYSFSVHHKLVMYFNGDVRKFGQRIPRSTNDF